ncbi:hypothetical protein [Roseburia sp. MSJ-14]|uniref:hypothetical protein n=1 Tax=Roseburia sp. MSJ-14 TaxID=2841514 RepID=UPI001C12665E|nr:hypothetical protein [Roseburia sp. MSJ-14]MBU5473590.1 hypothetical protein [Roseburia sp. MSJ-14]
MRKKILCAIMSAVMVVGALTGCGKKNDFKNTEKEKVTESVTEVVAETEAATESIEEKDEYLTIDTSTICSRELHDFFELYLRCWIDWSFESGKLNTGGNAQPTSIKNMMTHTGVVGAFTPANGMRIVSEYKEDDFSGLALNNLLHFTAPFYNYQTVNYSCSVSCLESNFSSFRYKEGTDAVLKMFVKVNYSLSAEGNSNDKSDLFAIELVNSDDNPEEWLIRYISPASDSLNANDREKYPDCNYVNNNGAAIDAQYYFTADKLINEDRENIDTSDMPAWKQAYIDYFNNSSLDLSEYNYILEDVNSDNIPELFLYNSRINDREFYYINKNNEVKSIEFTKSYIRAENGCVYITGGSQGYYYDSVSQCNANGDYESIFDGYNEEDLSGDTVSFRYYIGDATEVSEDEYERNLSAYKDMKSFGEEDSNQGDVISAIQNY